MGHSITHPLVLVSVFGLVPGSQTDPGMAHHNSRVLKINSARSRSGEVPRNA